MLIFYHVLNVLSIENDANSKRRLIVRKKRPGDCLGPKAQWPREVAATGRSKLRLGEVGLRRLCGRFLATFHLRAQAVHVAFSDDQVLLYTATGSDKLRGHPSLMWGAPGDGAGSIYDVGLPGDYGRPDVSIRDVSRFNKERNFSSKERRGWGWDVPRCGLYPGR